MNGRVDRIEAEVEAIGEAPFEWPRDLTAEETDVLRVRRIEIVAAEARRRKRPLRPEEMFMSQEERAEHIAALAEVVERVWAMPAERVAEAEKTLKARGLL